MSLYSLNSYAAEQGYQTHQHRQAANNAALSVKKGAAGPGAAQGAMSFSSHMNMLLPEHIGEMNKAGSMAQTGETLSMVPQFSGLNPSGVPGSRGGLPGIQSQALPANSENCWVPPPLLGEPILRMEDIPESLEAREQLVREGRLQKIETSLGPLYLPFNAPSWPSFTADNPVAGTPAAMEARELPVRNDRFRESGNQLDDVHRPSHIPPRFHIGDNPITRLEDMPSSLEALEKLAQEGRVNKFDMPFGPVYMPIDPLVHREPAANAITRMEDMPTSREELERLALEGRVQKINTPFGAVYKPFATEIAKHPMSPVDGTDVQARIPFIPGMQNQTEHGLEQGNQREHPGIREGATAWSVLPSPGENWEHIRARLINPPNPGENWETISRLL